MENQEYSHKWKESRYPHEYTNIISRLLYCWTIPIFIKGTKKDLEEDDLYRPVSTHESSKLGNRLDEVWQKERKRTHQPSLFKALMTAFKYDFIQTALILLFMEFVVKVSIPILIGRLMEYYKPDQTSISKTEAYTYAAILLTAKLLNIILQHRYMLGLKILGMKLRVSSSSLIYRKALKLSKTSLAKTTLGQMVNLLSNDVNRFDHTMLHIHYVWLTPIQTSLYLYLLYSQSGWTAMMGIALLVLLVPLQMFIGKRTSLYRHRTAKRTDERIRLMNEIISGIQVIKMYTWEIPFSKLVAIARKLEIKEIKSNQSLRAIIISFTMFVDRTAVYLCIIAYALSGHIPDPKYVYVVMSFYEILRQPITMSLPQAIQSLAEMKICSRRITTFLLYDELEKQDDTQNHKMLQNGIEETEPMLKQQNGIEEAEPMLKQQPDTNKRAHVGITITNGAAKWSLDSPDYTLNNINLDLSSKQLVAIVGPVGSGKTSLLHVILRELPLIKGSLSISGTISYAPQEPWLFGGSVRQNILFGEPFMEKKYNEVVRVCALERDFTLLPYGDRTLVGERGVSLSGGQKARINLARAVYKEADIYLLDDPLSAVDTHVGRQLFNDCITGYLREKCTVLVTHQLQYLKNVDRIFLVENGEIVASGTYQELQDSDRDYAKLLEDETENAKGEKSDADEEDALIVNCNIRQRKSRKRSSKINTPVEVKEHKSVGSVSKNVYRTYFTSGGTFCRILFMFTLYIAAQLLATANDYFITYWLNVEQYRQERRDILEQLSNNTLNNTLNVTSLHLRPLLWQSYFTTNTCIYVYSGLILSIIVVTLSRSLTFYNYCTHTSENLHNNMFKKIVFAPMRFFNTHPSGRILNRFSKDMGTVDESLPAVILDTIQIGLQLLAVTGIIAVINPWVIFPTAVIFLIFYGCKVFYLKTSRSVKRLEGVTKSPVFSHLTASLQGLTTIRAFRAEPILEKEFDSHQDLHTSAYFMFLACTRSFGVWLDLVCVVYIGIVTFGLLVLEREKYGGNIGLSMTQAMGLTSLFQWGMRQWCEVENQMTSVERIIEYTEIETEKETKSIEPPKTWPSEGKIEFKAVFLRYDHSEPYVLKDLNFLIQPKQKIGIVGRTGAGKSSLISALFRLTQVEGDIFIDDISTNKLSLHDVRSKISIIPQEPVLFSGTLRKNLDPFEEYEDEKLWSALEQVELKDFVNESPEGLNMHIAEAGSNFSVGQRQLLCLARAIIRNNKILILDEATANVDPRTDALIQVTIRRQFSQCTVLTIAHRLNTVMDSDKILVMDAGRAVEFDHPYVLLQNREGYLSNLVKETGVTMAENLINIAQQNYDSIFRNGNTLIT